MTQLSLAHKNDLAHHINQGSFQLTESAQGENTAALSYAALEFRFAIERLAVHYWANLLGRKLESDDFKDIESFKRVERRIYELAGHQKEIDGHFAFMRIVLSVLKIEGSLHAPKLGKLSKYWHDCSELCHISWPLPCSVLEVRQNAFTSLQNIAQALPQHVESMGWPVINNPTFGELRDKFVAGHAKESEVLAHFEKTGLWAQLVLPDGTESFVGEPVIPTEKKLKSINKQ